jgi:hypothetical protein
MNETYSPGSPFDILRAVSFVERPRACLARLNGVGGELHMEWVMEDLTESEVQSRHGRDL